MLKSRKGIKRCSRSKKINEGPPSSLCSLDCQGELIEARSLISEFYV